MPNANVGPYSIEIPEKVAEVIAAFPLSPERVAEVEKEIRDKVESALLRPLCDAVGSHDALAEFAARKNITADEALQTILDALAEMTEPGKGPRILYGPNRRMITVHGLTQEQKDQKLSGIDPIAFAHGVTYPQYAIEQLKQNIRLGSKTERKKE